MNFDIIKHQIGNSEVNSIYARNLHKQLKIKSRFNDWINNRIRKYSFLENEDFIWVTKSLVTQRESGQSGAYTEKDCIVTLDMAKELAMVENNEIGRNIRRYFIQIEKQFKATSQQVQPEHSIQKIENELLAIQKYFDNHQNLNQFRKDEMLKSLYEKIGLETCYFPKPIYISSSFSLTYLLEKFGISITPYEFNLKLENLGLIEKRFLDTNQYLWFILEKGNKFGENQEFKDRTTPKYFEVRFQELLELVSKY